MKVRMDELVNAYDASEWILDKDVPSDLAFRLAELMLILKAKREAFAIAVQKLKRDESGNIDTKEFSKLCEKEFDLEMPEIKADELKEAFEKIPVKVILSLLPVLGGTDNA